MMMTLQFQILFLLLPFVRKRYLTRVTSTSITGYSGRCRLILNRTWSVDGRRMIVTNIHQNVKYVHGKFELQSKKKLNLILLWLMRSEAYKHQNAFISYGRLPWLLQMYITQPHSHNYKWPQKARQSKKKSRESLPALIRNV